jgi:hypothetical protein
MKNGVDLSLVRKPELFQENHRLKLQLNEAINRLNEIHTLGAIIGLNIRFKKLTFRKVSRLALNRINELSQVTVTPAPAKGTPA